LPGKGYRIRVNSMHPGTIDTDMGDQVLSFTRKPWRLALFENVASATRHR